MYVRLPGEINIRGTEDTIKKNAVLYARHGDGSIKIASVPFRPACSNQLNSILRQGTNFRIGHYQNYERRIEDAKNSLRDVTFYYNKFAEIAGDMAAQQMSSVAVKDYFKGITETKAEIEGAEPSTRVKNIRDGLERLFVEGQGHNMRGVQGSLWAAFNAVAEWTDHHQSIRSTTDRNESVLLGSGARLKQKAMDGALMVLAA